MGELALADCLLPQWPAPAHVRAFVTTRAGGVSAGPYATLNLGFSTDDITLAVDANRSRLRGLLPQEPRWLKQVHGARVVRAESVLERPEADACVALGTNVVCAVLIADCLPVLLTDRTGTVVAAAHAGWRGLASGVLDNTVASIETAGIPSRELMAYIGPGIGPRAFEVGEDVYDAFAGRDPDAARAFTRHAPGKWLADLPALAQRALTRCGVSAVYASGLCTHSDPARFYSHRRDRTTGRMAALIWLAR